MVKATTCTLAISVEQALMLRDSGDSNFKQLVSQMVCIECGKSVRPFREGATTTAHFEHWERNPECSLSYPETK
jgi:hypothetical protein